MNINDLPDGYHIIRQQMPFRFLTEEAYTKYLEDPTYENALKYGVDPFIQDSQSARMNPEYIQAPFEMAILAKEKEDIAYRVVHKR